MQDVLNFFQQIDFVGILKWLFAFLVGDGGLLALMTFILTLRQNKAPKNTESDSIPTKEKSSFLKNAVILLVGFILLVGINVVIYMFVPKPEPTDFSYAVKEDNTVCITGLLNRDLSDYEIPATIKGLDVTEIKNNAFKDCDNITSITIPDTVKLIGSDAFEDCDNLLFVKVSESNEHFSSVDGVLYNKARTKLLYYPDENNKGKIIDSGVCGDYINWTLYQNGLLLISGSGDMDFKNQKENNFAPWCDYASQINLVLFDGPISSVATVSFRLCDRITSMALPDSVSKIGVSSFSGCTALTKITMPEHITTISDTAFVNCSSLAEIDLPISITSLGSGVFNKCTSLKSIAITDLVTSIPNGAFFLSGLETIELPKNLSRIEASAFCRCYNLKEINIPDSVTFIGHDAFSQCFELNEVHISKNTDTIEYGAFWKCSSLKSIVIPDSVESLESVTFQHCNDLSSITLPNSLKKIDHHNFSGCNNLKDVYFNGTEEEWKKIAIKDNNDPLISANIHYQG